MIVVVVPEALAARRNGVTLLLQMLAEKRPYKTHAWGLSNYHWGELDEPASSGAIHHGLSADLARLLDDPDGAHSYTTVSPTRIPKHKAALADVVLTVCAIDCRIPRPQLVWFEKTDRPATNSAPFVWRADCETRGWANLGHETILVSADLDLPGIAETTAHEVKHLRAERRQGVTRSEQEELIATEYGRWWRDFHGRGFPLHVIDGYPRDGLTLAGVAERGALVVAQRSGGAGLHLLTNMGSKRSPRWGRFEP